MHCRDDMEPLIIKLKQIAARLLNKEAMKVALHSSDTPLLIKERLSLLPGSSLILWKNIKGH